MAEKEQNIVDKGSAYRHRILLSLVVVELLAIGLFEFWPIMAIHDQQDQKISFNEDDIYFEDAIITRQQSSPPPPPRPQAPVPEPSDEVIEEDISLDALEVEDFGEALSENELGLEEETGEAVENPEVSPRVQHIVEPSIPEAARQAGINGRIWVNLLIGRKGNVEEVTISKIEVYDAGLEEYQTVSEINYGLPEVIMDAALQWEFRPARDNGQSVKSYSQQVFSFGT